MRAISKLGKPEKKESGSVEGAMHRAWVDAKVAVGGGDKTILESVEKGEITWHARCAPRIVREHIPPTKSGTTLLEKQQQH